MLPLIIFYLYVTCSAGVGRTGTFLAILTMMSRVDAGESVDIRGYVGVMRTKRMQMVQTLVIKSLLGTLCLKRQVF